MSPKFTKKELENFFDILYLNGLEYEDVYNASKEEWQRGHQELQIGTGLSVSEEAWNAIIDHIRKREEKELQALQKKLEELK